MVPKPRSASNKPAAGPRARPLATKRFASPRAWEQWLEKNHARSRGVWMKIAKRDGGAASLSYAQALEVALAFGWIDGQKDKLDQRFWLQKFTPRSAASRWSAKNRESAERLLREGRMRPAGEAEVERAKADGRWSRAYPAQSRAKVPPDLQRALDAVPSARAFFANLDSRNRFAVLYRVHDAKRPDTRAKRIAAFVQMLAEGETLHPQSRPRSH